MEEFTLHREDKNIKKIKEHNTFTKMIRHLLPLTEYQCGKKAFVV